MFEAGDLVLLPFPFSDLTSSKRRPVLMLTAPDAQGDFVGCPVTSRAGWIHARPLSPAIWPRVRCHNSVGYERTNS